MTYCKTPISAIVFSMDYDTVTRWIGDPNELEKQARACGYKVDSVRFSEQTGPESEREVVDMWGWTDTIDRKTPEGETDWRVYVEVQE